MDGFTSILVVLLAIVVIVIIIGIIKKMGKSTNLVSGIKRLISFFSDSDIEKDESDDENTQTVIVEGIVVNPDEDDALASKDEWIVVAYSLDGYTIRAVKFNKRTFAMNMETRREPHFTIGKSTENSLSVSEKYNTVSRYHGYVRYDTEEDAYYFWNDAARNGTFLDPQKTQPIRYGVKITDGLELYLAKEVRLLFKKI